MSLIPASKIIREFFDGLDLQRIDADLKLAQMQHYCTKNRDPKTCFLTVAFIQNRGPVISWGFRLEKHFGTKELDFSDYLELVHPAWKDYYNAMAQVAYSVAADEPDWVKLPEACYIVNVPLRKVNGKEYHWFRQLSIPALTDQKKGMLAAHLNYYTDLGPYDDHLPEKPTVYALFPEDPQKEKLNKLRDKFTKALPSFSYTLTEFLSEQQQQLLDAYRDHFCRDNNAPSLVELKKLLYQEEHNTSSKQGERQLNNIKRARTRLAYALRNHLETESKLATPTVFAKRLNLFFGCPQRTNS